MQGKNTVTYSSKYVIALYLRLLQEERDVSLRTDKVERNSIINQRALIQDFIKNYEEFLGVRFISVNDNYDSKEFEGTTGGFDVAF